jgi:hypothetical protein
LERLDLMDVHRHVGEPNDLAEVVVHLGEDGHWADPEDARGIEPTLDRAIPVVQCAHPRVEPVSEGVQPVARGREELRRDRDRGTATVRLARPDADHARLPQARQSVDPSPNVLGEAGFEPPDLASAFHDRLALE